MPEIDIPSPPKIETKKRRTRAQIDREREEFFEAIGFTLDAEQKKLMSQWRHGDKKFAYSYARQNGKTYILIAMALEVAAFAAESVMYSAHKDGLAQKTFFEFKKMTECLIEVGVIEKYHSSNGFFTAIFTNGARVYFKTRGDVPGFATGFTIGLLIFDEAQKLPLDIEAEALPVITHTNTQKVVYAGTPPTRKDREKFGHTTFMQMKIDGNPNLKEYSAYPEYNEGLEFDLALLKKANPGWRMIPNFTSLVKEMHETMSHYDFWTQYGAVWELPRATEQQTPTFTMAEVDSYITKSGSTASSFYASVGILPNSEKAYIAFNDGAIVEIVARFDVSTGDLYPIADWIKERGRQIKNVRLPANARGKALAVILREKNLEKKFTMVDMPSLSAKFSLFRKQLNEKTLRVFSAQDTKSALSSFWLGYEPRSGSIYVEAGLAEDAALVNALATAVVEGNIQERLRRNNSIPSNNNTNDNTSMSSSRRIYSF